MIGGACVRGWSQIRVRTVLRLRKRERGGALDGRMLLDRLVVLHCVLHCVSVYDCYVQVCVSNTEQLETTRNN